MSATESDRQGPRFTVVPCSCCDAERVMDFMTRTFYREEPVLLAAGLTRNPPRMLLEHTRASFDEGLSLMAVLPDHQDRICGVAINSIVTPEDACKLRQDAEAADCPATKRVLELWTMMLERPEIWRVSDGDVRCMLELRELATSEDMRGRGVGLQLALAAREVAADVGAPAYKIDCTSQYSANIAQKLGMKKVFSVPYASHLGEGGKPIFTPPCPHVEAAVYTQELSKDCQHKFGGEF
ncbi:uncharacterized protein LOC117644031 [Thrips palmi]|uniref:Uncharacterized protein LOC117644031 n=1 Tax=Thrips palmi TaxID=161013 RepID=A0A6P8YH74_THRPL|nr:uncharacterized protein LOC117644031 [Thrips palmi]